MKAAADAERLRRTEEQEKIEAAKAKASATVSTVAPKLLSALLEDFLRLHAQERLAPKTTERYREQAAYLSPELLATPVAEVTPLQLSREWSRLLKNGGHTRNTKTPRPLSAKSVRHIAGLVSSAFSRAEKWGLVTSNPVSRSEPPIPKKHRGLALTPEQQILVFESATGPWCLRPFLEMAAATGCRRGEILALRWSDIVDGRAMIARSLTQTRDLVEFKGTKTDRPRDVELPACTLAALDTHRRRQDVLRQQFGPDYQAGDLIFCNPDGTPLKPDSISSAVSLLFRRLKLPKGASLHSLRHTHASLLLADGVDLATESERLGHSSVRVTADIYSHAIRGKDQEAARRWDKIMRPTGGSREESTGVN